MFFRTTIDAAEEAIFELIEYCARKVSGLLGCKPADLKYIPAGEKLKMNRDQEAEQNWRDISFGCAMSSISILRYITDHMKGLSTPIVNFLQNDQDLLQLLVPLVEMRPWIREGPKGERQVFSNSKWSSVPKGEYSKLPLIEGQVWLAIYNLVMTEEAIRLYEITDHRKNNLLRVYSSL